MGRKKVHRVIELPSCEELLLITRERVAHVRSSLCTHEELIALVVCRRGSSHVRSVKGQADGG